MYCTPPARDLVLVMPMSYSDFDDESPNVVAQRKEEVNAFLERHAFLGVNSLRDTSDVFQHVRVKQLYPLDVAKELGDERMMNMLKMSGQPRQKTTCNTDVHKWRTLHSFATHTPPRDMHGLNENNFEEFTLQAWYSILTWACSCQAFITIFSSYFMSM